MLLSGSAVNDRISEQIENRRGDDASDHGRGNSFHNIGPRVVVWRPHDRKESEENRGDLRNGPSELQVQFLDKDNNPLEVSQYLDTLNAIGFLDAEFVS